PWGESDGSSATQAPERRLRVKTSTALRDEAVRPPGRLTLERLAKSRPHDDRDHDDDREPREAHDAPRAPLPGPWRRLGHERIALRGRLAGRSSSPSSTCGSCWTSRSSSTGTPSPFLTEPTPCRNTPVL